MVHVLETGRYGNRQPNSKPAVRGFNIINGQLTSASDKATFRSSNPALCGLSRRVPPVTQDDVRDALKAARKRFRHGLRPRTDRGQIIGNMGRLLMDHKDALVAHETREIGKPSRNRAEKFRKPSHLPVLPIRKT